MGPPLAALGLTLPRIAAAPSRTAVLQPVKAAANACWHRALGFEPQPRGFITEPRSMTLEMEWHMKRLCQRCGVIPDRLVSDAGRTLRPEPDRKWVLLWRDNQRHRPPSKR
jgi:hypothetical protein